MKKIMIFFVLIASTYAVAETPDYTPIEDRATVPILTHAFQDRKTAKIKLNNGLEVYLISDPTAEKSGAALSVKVGSWEDPEGYPGLAHFLEHMLFLGTEKYPEEAAYDRFISSNGGVSNAYTTNDQTSFIFTIDNTAFPEALDRFSSFFKHPLFNPSGVAREFQAIDQEFAKNVENDDIRELHVHKELAPKDHPYHAFNMGNSATLSKVSQETLKEWYKTHYSANLMRLVIYSAMPIEELKSLVIEDFKDVPNHDRPPFTIEKRAFPEELNAHFIYITPMKNLRKVTLIWELPSKFARMKNSQPESIVCYVLGHEGENSLLAELKREKLAEALRCGASEIGPNTMVLYLEIDLTKEGLKEINTVIKRSFQAISNFREKGVPEYLFDEVKQLATLRYQYQAQEDEYSSLITHSRLIVDEDLSTYPEQTMIPQKFKPKNVQSLLNYLTPEHVRIDILAPPNATGVETDRQEQWLDVAYAVKPIPEEILDDWKQKELHPLLDLPVPNPFIPKELKQLQSEKPYQQLPHPKVVLNNDFGKIYFAPDTHYLEPKVNWIFTIKTPAIPRGDASAAIVADLYTKKVTEALNPFSYPATLAGLEYTIKNEDSGIVLKIQGYSDQAERLFDEIVKQLKETAISPEKFRIYKEQLQRQYQNFSKEMPLKQAFETLKSVLYKRYNTEREKLAAIRRLSLKKFHERANTLFDQVYIEGMLYGNMTQEQAESIGNKISTALGNTPYPLNEQEQPEILVMPKEEGPFFLESKTQAQGNAVILAIENNNFSFKSRAAQQVLMQAMKQPFYSALRTQQQTAYMVYTSGEEVERQLFNLFSVQSNTHDVRELLSRFELFIESFLQELATKEVPEERFDGIKQALLYELQQPPKNLMEMGEQLNKLAFDYEGDFDWIEKRATALEELSYDEFLQYAQEFIGRQNKQRLAILLKGTIPEEFAFKPLRNANALHKISDYVSR